jgi:hypothetical protein
VDGEVFDFGECLRHGHHGQNGDDRCDRSNESQCAQSFHGD